MISNVQTYAWFMRFVCGFVPTKNVRLSYFFLLLTNDLIYNTFLEEYFTVYNYF